MRKIFLRRLKRPISVFSISSGDAAYFLIFLLTVGVIVGCIAGLYSAGPALPEVLSARSFVPETLWNAIWDAAGFFAFALLFSTSLLGLLLLPLLSLFRGYLLGCCTAALFASDGYSGLLCAALACGIPALISVPCFTVIARDAYLLSRRLFRLLLSAGPFPEEGPGLLRHLLLVFPLLALVSFYSFYLLPLLLSGL